MTLTEKTYHQARLMAQGLTAENQVLLEALCRGSVASLEMKLRDELTAEDCGMDFVTAAAMYAVAAMADTQPMTRPEEFSAGDLRVVRADASQGAEALRRQARLLMGPYLKTSFLFMGV